MNQDIPTPRTDAAWQRSKAEIGNWRDIAFDMRYFSQDLERENARLRAALELLMQSHENPFRIQMTKAQLVAHAKSALALGQTNPATGNVAPAQAAPDRSESDLRDEYNALHDLYMELIMEVGSKYMNETRHETALRYIREMDRRPISGPSCAQGQPEGQG